MAINVDNLSLKDLHELESKLAKAKLQAATAERTKLKEKIDNVLKGSGLSIHDLYGVGRRGRPRGKSAAKFANPDDRSQTWTGRGRKPNWLVAKLKRGAKVTDFAI
ncbi:MAG: H-NS histone family protein [Hyphomicrobium sp.]